MSGPTHAVIYAAKSTEDKHGSIPTQIEDCTALAERERWQVVGVEQDESFSAFSGNRGPGLERAKALAVATASEDGACVLVAQDADRFARGAGDAPGAADHLGEVYFAMKRQGVALWTVRSGHLDLLRAAIEGERSHDESARKTQAVKAGKKRQAENGEHLGGPLPLGYAKGSKPPARDPASAPTAERILELALEGVPDGGIARVVNEEGHRTRHGRPFDRRAVQAIVRNPFYAGLIVYEGEEFEGKQQPLVERDAWRRMVAARASRDLAEPSQKQVGRPARNHALARLAVCGRCGERMYAVTSSYKRKDGSRARSYQCHGYRFSTGTCDAGAIDAEAVDSAVIAGLDTLLVDFEAWRQRIEDGHSAERDRLANEVQRAQGAHDAEAHKAARVEAKWSEFLAAGDDAKADLVLPIVEKERAAATATERRLQAALDALASVPTEPPTDAMLDFANALRQAIAGRIDRSGTMAEVNRALLEVFACFIVREDAAIGWDSANPFKPHPERKQIVIQPWLKLGAIAPPSDPELGWAWPRAVNVGDDPPPLRWLSPDPDPEENVQNTQAYLLMKPKRGAFAASHA